MECFAGFLVPAGFFCSAAGTHSPDKYCTAGSGPILIIHLTSSAVKVAFAVRFSPSRQR